jgi:hypothetical protein
VKEFTIMQGSFGAVIPYSLVYYGIWYVMVFSSLMFSFMMVV